MHRENCMISLIFVMMFLRISGDFCTFYHRKLILAVKFTIEEIFLKFWDLFNLFLIFGSKHTSGKGGPSLIFAYLNASGERRECIANASGLLHESIGDPFPTSFHVNTSGMHHEKFQCRH